MQKKIIALAVAGLASTAAFAQSNVTVYGVVDMGFSRGSSSDSSLYRSRSAIDSGLQSGSRIGFKGVEDLGNGLKASFVLEYGVNADINDTLGASGGATARQQLLALSGNFGTVAVGRQYTPQYGLVLSMDPFGTGTVGDVTTSHGVYHMGTSNAAAQTIRLDNLVAYVSPNFGGFNVIAGYTANGIAQETATLQSADKQDAKVWAINPNYKNGPIAVGLNYHVVKSDNILGLGVDFKDRVWDLGASYDFGVAKLSGLYGQIKNSTGAADSKDKQWMVGLSVPVGAAGSVLASYSRNTKDVDAGADEKASKYAIGYTHNLSKRTNLYAAYAKIKTNDAAEGKFSVTNAVTATAGQDYTSGLNIGLRHNF